MNNLSKDDKQSLKTEMGLDKKDLGKLLKKLHGLENRDDKAFMDMLRTVSRNHYTLNQMVDRKARILLSANVLILSLIIGQAVTQSSTIMVNPLVLFVIGITAMVSMVLSLLAVVPEKTRGQLSTESFQAKQGNPLFFGNFVNMAELDFENAMMEMVADRDFIYRAMIQDTYHLGKMLESKRKILRNSLFIFVAGFSVSFFVVCFYKFQVLFAA